MCTFLGDVSSFTYIPRLNAIVRYSPKIFERVLRVFVCCFFFFWLYKYVDDFPPIDTHGHGTTSYYHNACRVVVSQRYPNPKNTFNSLEEKKKKRRTKKNRITRVSVSRGEMERTGKVRNMLSKFRTELERIYFYVAYHYNNLRLIISIGEQQHFRNEAVVVYQVYSIKKRLQTNQFDGIRGGVSFTIS